MAELPFETPKILAIYLQIANYPIMAQDIRRRMRDELFRRGVITPDALEEEARTKAIDSQRREGVAGLVESELLWQQRLQMKLDRMTSHKTMRSVRNHSGEAVANWPLAGWNYGDV